VSRTATSLISRSPLFGDQECGIGPERSTSFTAVSEPWYLVLVLW
jgi:hypothetical protein